MSVHMLVAVSRNTCLDSHSYSRVFLTAGAAQNSCYQGELDMWNEGKMCFRPVRLWLEITSPPVFFSNNHVSKLVRQMCLSNCKQSLVLKYFSGFCVSEILEVVQQQPLCSSEVKLTFSV